MDYNNCLGYAEIEDTGSFSKLSRTYLDQIYIYVIYQVQDITIAEYLTQRIFLEVFRGRKTRKYFEPNFSAWLYRIAHRRIAEYLRDNPPKKIIETQLPAENSNISQAVDANDTQRLIVSSIACLPEKQRQVIILKLINGLGNVEIGHVIGNMPETIKTLQAQALAALRSKLYNDSKDTEVHKELVEVLDECLISIHEGVPIERCLDEYSYARHVLEPLLNMAVYISHAPPVLPSEKFRSLFGTITIAHHRPEAIETMLQKTQPRSSELSRPTTTWQKLGQELFSHKRIAVVVTVMLILIGGLSAYMTLISPAPTSTPALGCTLSTLDRDVLVQIASSAEWQQAVNGLSLGEGSEVRTGPNARALLTFFEGTTIKLEQGTDISVQRIKYGEQDSIEIVLKQLLGNTWSQVGKKAGQSIYYELQTPSASAIARGTSFTVGVDESGATLVQVNEGTVAVAAQGEEVLIQSGYETKVEVGGLPSEPFPISVLYPTPTPTPTPTLTPTPTPTPTSVVHTLIVKSSGGGSVTSPGQGTYTYDEGTVVSLLTVPSGAHVFENWTGDVMTVSDINSAATTITMNGDYTITANFTPLRKK